MRVVLAEDNYLVREGTRRLLEETGQVEVVAAVATAEELLDAVDRLAPDAVITDIRMPPGHHVEGIVAAHAIRERHPEVGVVVLSQYADEAYAFDLLKNGVAGLGYVLKDRVSDTESLLRALHTVCAGESMIDSEIVEKLVARRARIADSPVATLTPREREVLEQMAQGKSNVAIGKALSLSESAIEKYSHSIFAKLDLSAEPELHRRVAAVLHFLEQTGIRPRRANHPRSAWPKESSP